MIGLCFYVYQAKVSKCIKSRLKLCLLATEGWLNDLLLKQSKHNILQLFDDDFLLQNCLVVDDLQKSLDCDKVNLNHLSA